MTLCLGMGGSKKKPKHPYLRNIKMVPNKIYGKSKQYLDLPHTEVIGGRINEDV